MTTPQVRWLPSDPQRPITDENGFIEAGMSRRGVHYLAADTTCRRITHFHKVYGLRDSGARYDIGSMVHLAGSHIAAQHQWPGEFMPWREALARKADMMPGWSKYEEEATVLSEHLEAWWNPQWEVMGLELQLELNANDPEFPDRWITCRLDVLIRHKGKLQIVDFKTAADTLKANRTHFNKTPQAKLFGLISDLEPILATSAFWIIPKKLEQREKQNKAGKALIFTAPGAYRVRFKKQLWAAVDELDETFDTFPPGAFDRARCSGCFAKMMCYGVTGS